MKKMTTFGELLGQLLEIRSWSAAKLARLMNLDPSYVQKWVRGVRVPSIQGNHIGNIVQSITFGTTTAHYELMKQVIVDKLKLIDEDNWDKSPIDEILHNVLEKTQIYSLSLDASERKIDRLYDISASLSIFEEINILKDTKHQYNRSNFIYNCRKGVNE